MSYAFAAALVLAAQIQDGAQLLTDPQRVTLMADLERVEAETGAALAVVTSNSTTASKEAAITAGRELHLGSRGLVFYVSMTSRQVYLQPGHDLAQIFDNEVSTEIVRHVMVPALKAGAYLAAFEQGLVAARARLPLQEAAHVQTGAGCLLLFFGLAGVVLVGLVILFSRRERRYAVSAARSTYVPTPYVSPYPSVLIESNSSNFVQGMLIGEALSRPAPAPAPVTFVEHNTYVDTIDTSSSGSSDSSYDSGSSFDGGFDGGGGGGGDFGGGGGGSDF